MSIWMGSHYTFSYFPDLLCKESIIAWSGGGENAEVKGEGAMEGEGGGGRKRERRISKILIIYCLDYQPINK
jgi:hypothetical protein